MFLIIFIGQVLQRFSIINKWLGLATSLLFLNHFSFTGVPLQYTEVSQKHHYRLGKQSH